MREKYRILGVMAVVYKVLAWVTLILGLTGGAVLSIGLGGAVGSQIGSAGAVIAGFGAWTLVAVYSLIGFGAFYALGEAIHLLFDIEAETRVMEREATGMKPAA